MARGGGGRLVWGAVALGVLTAARAGRADEERFRSIYRAHEGCPSERQFADEVLARARGARLATEGQAAYRFDVEVVRTESGSRGRLEVMDVQGTKSSREVDGKSCGEVVSGLALVAALTLDPRASIKPAAALAPPPEPAPEVLAPSPSPPPTNQRAPAAVHVNQPQSALPARPAGSRAARGTAGAHIGASSALPGMVAASVFVEIHRPPGEAFGWALRISALAAPTAEIATGAAGGPTASFQWLAGRLEGCPTAVHLLGRTWAYPCAGFELGRIDARGLRVSKPAHDTVLWETLFAALRVRSDIVGVLFVELQGAVVAPLRRQTFVFERPSAVAYEVPGFGVMAEAGVGAHFL